MIPPEQQRTPATDPHSLPPDPALSVLDPAWQAIGDVLASSQRQRYLASLEAQGFTT